MRIFFQVIENRPDELRLSAIAVVGIASGREAGNRAVPRPGFGFGVGHSFRAAQAVEMPVVEGALGAPRGFERIARLGFLDEGLGLAALDALGEIELAAQGGLLLRIADARQKGSAAARGGERLFEAGEPVNELAGNSAAQHQAAAGAITRLSGGQRIFQLPQSAEREFKRASRLFFLEMKNAQQAAQRAGGGHEFYTSAANAARRARQSAKAT